MVRRSVILLACICILSALPIIANAATVYDEGNISSSYVDIFRDIASNINPFDDYVFFRADKFEYKLVVGDIKQSPAWFTADKVKVYTLIDNKEFSDTYLYTTSEESDWSLSAASSMVYSNLGDYPELISRTDKYIFCIVLFLMIFLCMYLLRSIFIRLQFRVSF